MLWIDPAKNNYHLNPHRFPALVDADVIPLAHLRIVIPSRGPISNEFQPQFPSTVPNVVPPFHRAIIHAPPVFFQAHYSCVEFRIRDPAMPSATSSNSYERNGRQTKSPQAKAFESSSGFPGARLGKSQGDLSALLFPVFC